MHLTPFQTRRRGALVRILALVCPVLFSQYLTGACESRLSAAFTGLAYCAYSHGIIELMQNPCVTGSIWMIVRVINNLQHHCCRSIDGIDSKCFFKEYPRTYHLGLTLIAFNTHVTLIIGTSNYCHLLTVPLVLTCVR